MSDQSSQLKLADEYYAKKDYDQFEKTLTKIIQSDHQSEDALKAVDEAIMKLSAHFVKEKADRKMQEIMQFLLDRIEKFPKAKAAKLAKQLMDQGSRFETFDKWQIEWCGKLRDWCIEKERTFLRQRVEIRLANLHWRLGDLKKALDLIEPLVKEVRKVDDKHLLVEVELLESKIYHTLENLSKAKASLTAARAASNSIYCPPLLQAELDLMSGVLMAEEKDYKTAFSYFYEAFEGLSGLNEDKAIYPLKYMILCKVMINAFDDVSAILGGKYGLRYAGPDLEAMKAVTQAHKHKSLREFKKVLDTHADKIQGDSILKTHIKSLFETLTEQNLFQIVEPYSTVQIDFIADKIGLTRDEVQAKLSEMILDKKFDGTLDQGNGCLIIFEQDKVDNLFETSLTTISNLNNVVDKLFEKVKLLKS